MGIFDTSLFIASILLLFYAGGIMIKALVLMARYLKIHEYILSFVLVALATSLPELFVGVTSAISGEPLFSLGNVIGANAFDLTLVLGIAIVLAGGISSDHTVRGRDIIFTLATLLFPVFFISDGLITRVEGFVLLLLFCAYIVYLVDQARKSPTVDHLTAHEYTFSNFLKNFGEFILGTILLLLSAAVVVAKGLEVAGGFALPIFFVGLLVALGTTLPEMIFGIKSVAMRHSSMSLGNVLGSVVVNTSLVLGVVALIHPIVVRVSGGIYLGFFLAIWLTLVLQLIIFLRGSLSRWFGIFLVATGLIFLFVEGLL